MKRIIVLVAAAAAFSPSNNGNAWYENVWDNTNAPVIP